MKRPGRAGLVCCLVFMAGTALGAERILSYHSDIEIHVDGSMTVVETIRVRAEGANIRRGIYRDFPTDYKDGFGNRYRVEFRLLGVTRDGRQETWRSEQIGDGVRIYVGRDDVFLDPSNYEYALRYRTDRQLGFFEDHDELYWNVTGNGWAFPVDVASAVVTLPEAVPPETIGIVGYTGPYGARARNAEAAVHEGRAWIETTRPLRPGEGLTLVATWPKGYITAPTRGQRLGWLLSDNRGLLIALAGMALILAYLSLSWSRYGRDPPPGVIFPQYEPPENYSPASARFVREMGYDDRTFAAAVVNLAVKGYVEIRASDGDYALSRKDGGGTPLAPGERVLLSQLFTSGPVIELDDANHKIIGGARRAHRRALKVNYEKIYFLTNTPLLIPAIAVAVGVVGAIALIGGMTPAAIVVVGLTVLAIGVFYFLMKAATPRGRELMDRLEGFRLYLDVAERGDLNLRNPPERTPELFERYLPFALALGVEQAWAEQFADVFARLGRSGQGYQPAWYHGDFNPSRIGHFSSSVGKSLTRAIAASATPPGSSSGSGGGGFSGGGGGGGGGGGW